MTPSDREAAGQRIARARRRRGLSQAVLAGLAGRSESRLSQVERGKRDAESQLQDIREIPADSCPHLLDAGDPVRLAEELPGLRNRESHRAVQVYLAG